MFHVKQSLYSSSIEPISASILKFSIGFLYNFKLTNQLGKDKNDYIYFFK